MIQLLSYLLLLSFIYPSQVSHHSKYMIYVEEARLFSCKVIPMWTFSSFLQVSARSYLILTNERVSE